MSAAGPDVSVLMSVYNGADYLPEAIDSILAQTYEDFEFIVVDDGSTDGSSDIIGRCRDNRILLLRNDRNMGLSASLNRGLSKARGDLVARMDADDISIPGRLSVQVEFMRKHTEISVIGSWIRIVDENGRVLEERRRHIRDFAEYLLVLLQGSHWLSHPTVMFRREDVLSVGGYDDSLMSSQDYDLWTRLVMCGKDVRILQDPLVQYRCHSKQVSEVQGTSQQENKKRSHSKLVARFVGQASAEFLSPFLRRDDSVWQDMGVKDSRAAGKEIRRLRNSVCSWLGVDSDRSRMFMRRFSRLVLNLASEANRRGYLELGKELCALALSMRPQLLISPAFAVWLRHRALPRSSKGHVRSGHHWKNRYRSK